VAAIDERLELPHELFGESGVVDQRARLDVALLAALSEVRGADEHVRFVDDDELGVHATAMSTTWSPNSRRLRSK
jgi:hypothetical protein